MLAIQGLYDFKEDYSSIVTILFPSLALLYQLSKTLGPAKQKQALGLIEALTSLITTLSVVSVKQSVTKDQAKSVAVNVGDLMKAYYSQYTFPLTQVQRVVKSKEIDQITTGLFKSVMRKLKGKL